MYQKIIKKLKYNNKLCVNLVGFIIYIKKPIEKHINDLLSGYPNFKNIWIRIIIRIRFQIENYIRIRIQQKIIRIRIYIQKYPYLNLYPLLSEYESG
jgi:hypothetical protein